MLAAGILSVSVSRKPRVLIIPSGDEIIQPEDAKDPLKPGVILEVNGQVLSSMVEECGAESALTDVVPDNPDKIRSAILSGFESGFDLVLTIAGSSAGTEDFTPNVLQELGELLVHGITVMPGKPTLLFFDLL